MCSENLNVRRGEFSILVMCVLVIQIPGPLLGYPKGYCSKTKVQRKVHLQPCDVSIAEKLSILFYQGNIVPSVL